MTEKQPFFGPIIAGAVVKEIVGRVLNRAADSTNISLEKKDVPAINAAITKEVVQEVESRIVHENNTEPFYQSRVTLGSLLTIGASFIAIAQLYTDGIPNDINEYYVHFGVIFGGLTALYGRYIAVKPLGA